jgi:hypothetical protein
MYTIILVSYYTQVKRTQSGKHIDRYLASSVIRQQQQRAPFAMVWIAPGGTFNAVGRCKYVLLDQGIERIISYYNFSRQAYYDDIKIILHRALISSRSKR